jgi:hypothetical protein
MIGQGENDAQSELYPWKNREESPSQLILILYPADQQDEPGGRHFTKETHE